MKVIVDRDLCQSHAVCTREAPEVFEIDANSDQLVIKVENPDPALRAKVLNAVKYCPNSALSIKE